MRHLGGLLAVAVAAVVLMFAPGADADSTAGAQDEGGGRTDLTIQVPAFHGIEPTLELRYDARSGNGWLGTGWSMTGISQIGRSGPGHGVPAFDNSDQFVLDGLDLVPCPSADSTPDCLHPSSSGVPLSNRYTTSIETNQRIEFAPGAGGGSWIVWRPDGVKLSYQPRLAPGWQKPPISWHLAKVTDPRGNTVSYNYAANGDAAGIGQEYLRRIVYNGTIISFQPQARPDVVTAATGAGLLFSRERLARIDVATGGQLVRGYLLTYRAASSDGNTASVLADVRQFGRDAVLGPGGTLTSGTTTTPLRMATVTPGAHAPGSFSSQTSPQIPWDRPWPDNGFRGASNWDNETAVSLAVRLAGQRWFPGDVDGDGRSDYLGISLDKSPPDDPSAVFLMTLHVAMPNRLGSRLQNETGTGRYNYRYSNTELPIFWRHNPQQPFFRAMAGDINGDGRSDVVVIRLASDSADVWAHTAISLGDGRFEVPPPQKLAINWNPRHRWFLADVSGDGRSDLVLAAQHPACDAGTAALTGCTVGNTFQHAAFQAGLSQGDGTWAIQPMQETGWSFLEGDDAHWFAADVNGDGRADIQRVVNHGPHDTLTTSHAAIQTALSAGTGFQLLPIAEVPGAWQSWASTLPWSDQQSGSDLVYAGDMNGDGRGDLVLASTYTAPGDLVRLVTAFSNGDGTYQSVTDDTALSAQHLNVWWERQHADNRPNRWMTGDWNGDDATDLIVASPDRFDAGARQWPLKVSLTRLLSDRHGHYSIERPAPTPFYFDCWDKVIDDPAQPPQCPEDLSFTGFMGDVNGDGSDDFMYAGGKFSEALQKTYFTVQVAPLSSEDTHRWSPADIDGDGRDDLIYPQYTSAGVTVHTLLRQPGGGWNHVEQPVMPFLYNPAFRAWTMADVGSTDGGPDGRADLLYVLYDDDLPGLRVYSLLSKGDGSWDLRYAQATWPGYDKRDTVNWRLADVDADGDADLLHVTWQPGGGGTAAAHTLRVDVMRSDGAGGFAPVPADPAPLPVGNYRADDSLGWRPMDVNGDGRSDLVHLDGRNHQITPLTLFSDGDGTFTARFGQPVPGVDTGAVRSWRATGLNNDAAGDLVYPGTIGATLRPISLLGDGSGSFVARTSSALGQFGTDTRRWQTADVDGDGISDLIRVASAGTSARVTTLHGRMDGTFAADQVAGVAADTPDVLNWHPADPSGDGRQDMVRVEYGHPGLTVRTLESASPRALVTSMDNGIGGRTEIRYAPSSDFGTRVAPSTGERSCYLPLGVVVQLPAAIIQHTLGTPDDEQDMQYACARWSHQHRRLLGWAEVTTTHRAAANRPIQVSVETSRFDDACLSRTSQMRTLDGADRLLTKVTTGYGPDDPSEPYQCRPESVQRWNFGDGQAAAGQRSDRSMRIDQYGNVIVDAQLGDPALPADDQVLVRTFTPSFGSWILGAPASEELRDSTQQAGFTTYRRTIWCYAGQNGTVSGSCPGVPGQDALPTAVKRLGDDGKYRTTTYTYDASGNQTSATDPLQRTSTVRYDTVRNIYPEKACNALAQCTSTEWDTAQGLITASTNLNGRRTTYQTDALARPTVTVLPNGVRSTRRYLDWGDPNARQIQDIVEDGSPDGLWSQTRFDGLDRPLYEAKEGDRPGTSFTRFITYSDASARPATTSNWSGPANPAAFERLEYDAAGRAVSQVHADGTRLSWTYGADAASTWVTSTDERGNTKQVITDAQGRLAQVRESDGSAVSTLTYGYDAAGQQRTRTDDLGDVTTTSYDLLGRMTETTDPDLGRWTYAWDNAGNLRHRTDARGRTLNYGYDAINRLRTKTYPDGSTARWVFDEAGHGDGIGRLTSTRDPTGQGCAGGRTRSLSYDSMGLTTSSTYCVDGDSRTMGFDYDGLGRPKTVIYPGNERITYNYDPAGRLLEVPGLVAERDYDPDGHLVRTELDDSTITSWAYDPQRHWLTSMNVGSPVTGNLLALGYSYYPDGLVKTSSAAPDGPNLSFGYDGLDRLTSVMGDLSQQLTWNTVGNLQTDSDAGSFRYPAAGSGACTGSGFTTACTHPHAATSAGKQSYAYDASGNTVMVRSRVSPLIGATRPTAPLRATSTRLLTWDDDNRLSLVQDDADPAVRMLYNADGERVEKRQGDQITHYFGPWLEESYPGNGTTRYYFAGSSLIARRDGRGLHYVHSDHLGTPRMLTTGTGQVSARYSYRPFGSPLARSGSTTTTLGFTGAQRDDETGLVQLGARYYDAGRARFLSPDTVIPDLTRTQAANRYLYTYGNPLSWTDPTGHDPCENECVFDEGEVIGPDEPVVTSQFCEICPITAEPPSAPDTTPATAPAAPDEPSVFSGDYWRQVWRGYSWYLDQLDSKQETYDKLHDKVYSDIDAAHPLMELFSAGVTDDPVENATVAQIGPRPSNILGDVAEIYANYLVQMKMLAAGTPGAAAESGTAAEVAATEEAAALKSGGTSPKLLYRSGSRTPDNMTPKLPKDAGGLSTFDSIEAGIEADVFKPGSKVQVIDTEKLNCLWCKPDASPPGHVSVAPTDMSQMPAWAATRGTGQVHSLTQELLDALVGEERIPK